MKKLHEIRKMAFISNGRLFEDLYCHMYVEAKAINSHFSRNTYLVHFKGEETDVQKDYKF